MASRHEGLVHTADLTDVQTRRLRRMVDGGYFERVAKGVYRASGAPTSWRQQLRIGLWSLGDTAVVSHAAAAQLHGLDRFTRDRLEFTVDRAHRRRCLPGLQGAVVHSTVRWCRGDRLRVAGFPVTSPARTIVDLARSGVADVLVEAAIDAAMRLRLTDVRRLADRVAREQGTARWGLGRLERLLIDSGGESLLERRFLQLLRRHGFPRPIMQEPHRDPITGASYARVDFRFPGTDVVVEVSGARGHSSNADRGSDAIRRNRLQRQGRQVIEFTYDHVTHHEQMVVATLVDAGIPRSVSRKRPPGPAKT